MTPASSSARGDARETPLARLSRPPANRWPDGVLHHGSRVLLWILVAVAVTSFFPGARGLRFSPYQLGVVASEDLIAEVTFGVPKDMEELDRERAAAAAAVPPTFRFDAGAAERMSQALDGLFETAATAERESQPDQAMERLLSERGLVLTSAQRGILRDAGARAVLANASRRAVADLLPEGVLDEAAPIEPGPTGRILIVAEDGSERFVALDDARTTREFYEGAAQELPRDAGSELNEVYRLALIRYIEPSLRFDAEATGQDRDASRRAVPVNKATVLQGEAIVRANQQVGEAEAERIRVYEEALRAQGRLEEGGLDIGSLVAAMALNILVLGVFGGLLVLYRPDVYGNFRWLLLLAILILAFTGAGGVIARNELAPELLPIAFVSLATAVLWDGRLALILAATLAALVGTQPPFYGMNVWLPVFVAGSAAALSVRAVRSRAQTWIFIAIIVGAYLAVLASIGVVLQRNLAQIMESFAWAGGNAVVSAILAMGFLPVFEWFTRITTDQTLLEWADPNRPLLKRLSMEAPGTYAHTINLANLSEAAANAIGANGLLCRVGVYYHDVGKVAKPHYFIENQPSGRNPHDKLKPATSAAIVKEHVSEGIRLAKEAHLPEVLVDFIPEHHGTQEISFFYERARAELEKGEELDPEQYRYPGPRPQSRETAIVMLADSVESAARALHDPTRERLRDLMDSIVEDKIQQGQLDEAPMTLRELGIIREQFLKVLAGVYHTRIDYPQTRHLTESHYSDPARTPPPAFGAPAFGEGTTEGPGRHRSEGAGSRRFPRRGSLAPALGEGEPALFPVEGPLEGTVGGPVDGKAIGGVDPGDTRD
ncbi:MAG: HDIG domain-containing protein [Gemmatimonadetes bacterium]|nr:HDIG domain-containing protein [Gemmatimonadota bacterium]